MNKSELVASIAESANLTKKDAENALNGFLSAVEGALSKGEKILLDEELEVNGSKTSLPTNVIEVKYPLRPGFEISFVLPKDLSKKESERLSLYFSTLYFEE